MGRKKIVISSVFDCFCVNSSWIFRAAAIPRANDGARFQMKLVYDELTPLVMFLLQWIDSSCTYLLPRYLNLVHVLVYKVYTDERAKISRCGRKATIKEFYAVILPSLRRLHCDLVGLDFPDDGGSAGVSSVMEITDHKKPENVAGFFKDKTAFSVPVVCKISHL